MHNFLFKAFCIRQAGVYCTVMISKPIVTYAKRCQSNYCLSVLLRKKHLQLLFTIRLLRTAAHRNSVQQVCNYSKSNIKSCGSMASSFCTSHKNMTCQRHAQTTPLCAKSINIARLKAGAMVQYIICFFTIHTYKPTINPTINCDPLL